MIPPPMPTIPESTPTVKPSKIVEKSHGRNNRRKELLLKIEALKLLENCNP